MMKENDTFWIMFWIIVIPNLAWAVVVLSLITHGVRLG